MIKEEDMINAYLDYSGEGVYSPRLITNISYGSGTVMFIESDQATEHYQQSHMVPLMDFFLWLFSRIEK